MSRPTVATLKSFIRKNRAALQIMVKGEFDGMIDGMRFEAERKFQPIADAQTTFSNNLGIRGIWLVGGSRDYVYPFAENGFIGFSVSNSCASFVVAVQS